MNTKQFLSRLGTSLHACVSWSAILAVSLMAHRNADAQVNWPQRPVKIIVPYVAGSPADALARIVADGLARRLNQAVVVDNKAGANAIIGTQAVASGERGYVFGLGTMDSHSLNPLLYEKLPYDPEKGFDAVAALATTSLVLVSSPNNRIRTGPDIVQSARRQPGAVTYGSWGYGSLGHIWGLQLQRAAAVQLLHVPFQGSPATLQALLSQQIDLMFMLPTIATQMEKEGKLQIVGATSSQRLAAYPSIPTLDEQGFRGFSGTQWFGLFAPTGTDLRVLERMNLEVNTVLAEPDIRAKLSNLSMQPEPGPRASLAKMVSSSRASLENVVKINNIRLD